MKYKVGIEKRKKILKGEEPGWLATQQRPRRDAISEETKEISGKQTNRK